MAIEYKIQISPTLESDKVKVIAENLKKAFAVGKIDIDLSPMVETVS